MDAIIVHFCFPPSYLINGIAFGHAEVTTKVKKRDDYLSWDDYFMSLAFLSAKRSKDPSTQVGATIVNQEKKIVGIGYNGLPMGCNDDEFPWSRDDPNKLEQKYFYVVHAEANAILNKNESSLKGCRVSIIINSASFGA